MNTKIETLTLLGLGRTASIYALPGKRVLKLFNPGTSPESVQREMERSQLVTRLNLPVPRFIESMQVDGRPGLVFERVQGTSMLHCLIRRPWQARRLGRDLGRLHSLIHHQEGRSLPGVRPGLEWAIRHATGLPADLLNPVLSTLFSLPDGQALCHADFHPDQVMMTDHGPVVLDWANALQGHPLADVARTTILIRLGQLPYGNRLLLAAINGLRRQLLAGYLDEYFRLNPHFTRPDLNRWLAPVAAARLEERIPGEAGPLLELVRLSLAGRGL